MGFAERITGLRKIIFGLVILTLATILLCFGRIKDTVWSHVVDITTMAVVGGNVAVNVGYAVGNLFKKGPAKES